MDNQQLGAWLKKRAKASGNYVSVEIDNVYNTLESLATFFYSKKHEWIAICFLDENFICKSIWFNKGLDRTQVHLGISVQEAASHAEELGCKFIIMAHNHPISSLDMPEYSTKRERVAASYLMKEAQFGFSEADETTANYWKVCLSSKNLGFAETVIVAGDILIQGDENIINNFSSNKKSHSKNKNLDLKSNNKGCMLFVIVFFFVVIASIYPYRAGALIPILVILSVIGLFIWSFK